MMHKKRIKCLLCIGKRANGCYNRKSQKGDLYCKKQIHIDVPETQQIQGLENYLYKGKTRAERGVGQFYINFVFEI